MSQRLDKSWVVLASIPSEYGDRCVDVFQRRDASFGFEEFRKDAEDAGAWTPVTAYASMRFASKDEALKTATRVVAWLPERLPQK